MSLGIEAVAVRYGERVALRTTTLELAAGRLVALVGPNGAGKSTLLKAVAGLVPAAGAVAWGGQPLGDDARLRARMMAYLPQAPAAHWPMRVRDLVALGRLPHRMLGAAPGPADLEAVRSAMRETDIEALAERSVEELSGGERARVQLARALAVRAPILLVDEPVAALDPFHQLQIMHVLTGYAAREAVVVAVMHDLTLAARFAARMILMHEGAVVADGPPARVLEECTLRRYYRVEPYIAEHEGQALVVPWRTL